ncbi:MAG TPA: SatD family protein [Bacillota bacterium]
MAFRYIALKTDMIHSRALHERDKIQELFFAAADRINTDFGSCFESGFIITHGDEAQALIRREAAASVYPIIESLVEMMKPVELRFGLGWGTLSTKMQKMAIGMDGEAWQNAKEAIDIARKSRRWVCFRGFSFEMQKGLESLANLLLFIHGHWTPEQLQAIGPIRTGQTQATIAKTLHVTEAAISKRLSAAGWREYQDGREALQELMTKVVLTLES